MSEKIPVRKTVVALINTICLTTISVCDLKWGSHGWVTLIFWVAYVIYLADAEDTGPDYDKRF